jgi:hypothetical protein
MMMWTWLLSLLPSDWMSAVWGAIPTAGIAKWWSARNERLKQEAVGSHLTDRREEQTADELRWRYFDLNLKTWTGTRLRIISSRVAWPPTARAADRDELLRYPNEETFKRSNVLKFDADDDFTEIEFEILVRVSRFMVWLPAQMSRLTIVITVETVDAQRRVLKYKVRSSEVDWGKR